MRYFGLCSEVTFFFISYMCVGTVALPYLVLESLRKNPSPYKLLQFMELAVAKEINLCKTSLKRNFTKRINSMLPFQELSKTLLKKGDV